MSESGPKRSPLRAVGSALLWVVLPLLLGVVVAWRFVPQPAVGLVRLEDTIWSGSAADVSAQLAYARRDPAIRAIVFVVNSPGGEVSSSETIYLEVLQARREKPVVGVTEGLAASGAYYAIVATDYIYAKPSSIVGNIGVISPLPLTTFVEEDYMATGPFKLFGSSREDYVRSMDSMKDSFLNSVMAQRGARLRASRAELSRGQIYLGMNGLELGLIDDIGTVSDAAAKAAEMARIHDYRIVDILTVMGQENAQSSPYNGKRVNELPDGFYYLYTGPR
jgi:protease-4